MHTAKLDWITPDAEKVIARHARVSTSNPDREEYARLLSYCIKHGHWSILEQANVSFEIITSRAISAQLIRHKKPVLPGTVPAVHESFLKRCQTAFTIDLKSFQFESKLIRIVSQALKTLIQGCLLLSGIAFTNSMLRHMRSIATCLKQVWHENVQEIFFPCTHPLDFTRMGQLDRGLTTSG